jgi:hypothetical protein
MAFTACTVKYDSTSDVFTIGNGTVGNSSVVDFLICNNNMLELLRDKDPVFSQGVDAKTYADCLDRLYLSITPVAFFTPT